MLDETPEELESELDEIEREMDQIENELDEMENERTNYDDMYIPAFIRGYSDSELIKLLEIFVNPSGDYQNLSREKLEILYKN